MDKCEGTLSEPEVGRLECSLGERCAALPLVGRYRSSGDDKIAQQIRDAHFHREPPAWVTG